MCRLIALAKHPPTSLYLRDLVEPPEITCPAPSRADQMKLTKVRITNFQSVQDSNEFEIGDVTCLVGKNEAGKTALLRALYRLNPVDPSDGDFDPTDDYPRQYVSDYEDAVESGDREPDNVVHACYSLDSDDLDAVSSAYGSRCITDNPPTVTICKGYSNEVTLSGLSVDETEALNHIIDASGLSLAIRDRLGGKTAQEMTTILEDVKQEPAVDNLLSKLNEVAEHGVMNLVYNIIRDRMPKFLYFDEYYQLRGKENLDELRARQSSGTLKDSDQPLLGLISLAGINLEQMADPRRTIRLISKLDAAENHLTSQVLPYWSQNRHLRMKFDIRHALPDDPEGMRSGMNVWSWVVDTVRNVSTELGTRSRGFIWFFSFLAWYSNIRREEERLILLLDEPGLSLHAMAQKDLLDYFEKELEHQHQLIYTTHSPFMVNPKRFEVVRIVQDMSVDVEDPSALSQEDQGTRVITEILRARSDSLFPLQGALGYEISQTLFVGPNCLVVEGVTDLLYIQTISAVLQGRGRDGLCDDWTITPVGGAGNVPTFIALIGARTDLNVAVLIDFQKKDRQTIESLYKEKLVKEKSVLTYANYVDGKEADVEDMFDPGFYLKLVEGVYGTTIDVGELSHQPRIVQRIEHYLSDRPLPGGVRFSHYRPASYLSTNIESLVDRLTDVVLNRFQRVFDDLNALL